MPQNGIYILKNSDFRVLARLGPIAVLAAVFFAPEFAAAGGQPGLKIGTVIVAEQAAASPTMAPTVDVMRNKPVRQKDRLITGPFGHMHIRFVDDSEISIGAEADITLDNLVFSPGEKMANQFSASIVGGAFRYLSGKIAKLNGPQVTLRTPLATIGIRGTHILAIVDENFAGCIVLLEDPRAKGKPSAMTVTANGKTVVVDRPGWGTEVAGAGMAPTAPRTWSKQRIAEMLKMSGGDPDQ